MATSTVKRSTRNDVRLAVLALLGLAYVIVTLSQLAAMSSPRAAPRGATIQAKTTALRMDTPTTVAHTPAAMAEAKADTGGTTAPSHAPSSILRGRRMMVFIINFLDSRRCGQSLESLFGNAASPELLRVSIHDQIREELGDLPCVEEYCQRVGERKCRRSQIVSTKVKAAEAKGPTVARYITEKALGDEELCLGLDSHLVFVPKWDEKAVLNWEATNNPNAILTVYPKSTEYKEDHSKDDKMGVMCTARIEQPDPDSMVQYQGVVWLDRDNTTKPRLMSQFAGGFNFGPCQAYRDVPNDPYTPILFYGEEYVRAARLWTWGYDFYAPSVDILFHYFETRTKIWELDWVKKFPVMARSKRRVRFMMGLPVSVDDFDHAELDKYGLGKKRSFAQWKQFSGIDPVAPWTNKTRSQFQNCGELQLVPYPK